MWFKLNLNAIVIVLVLSIGSGCTSEKNTSYRILTAGIRHESNSFMPYLTTAEDFIILRGVDVTKDHTWASFLEEKGVEVIPTLTAISGPSGIVSKEAYESFRDEILKIATSQDA